MHTYKFAVLLTLTLTLPHEPAEAQTPSQAELEAAAINDLQGFLNDARARHEFAKTRPDAAQTNNYLEKFPPWAQSELIDIVMTIVRESKLGAVKHTDAFKSGGAQAAMASFSPQVKARIDRLQQMLSKDPSFNTPENLALMKSFMPQFLSVPNS